MKMMKKGLVLLVCILFIWLSGCSSPELQYGVWRGVLKTDRGIEIPFNFELKDSADVKIAYLLNGTERLKVDDVSIDDDSVLFRLSLFDSEIRAVRSGKGLKGKWIKHLASTEVSMDFSAQPGISWRFFKVKEDFDYTVSGRWSAMFTRSNPKDTTIAVGEFKQKGNKVTGTFLTATGDYRFLEGCITSNQLFLSAFDGSNAYLFTGELENDSTIRNGLFYSGLSSLQKWTAIRDDKAMLPDAYSLTTLKPGKKSIDFSFQDLDGRNVSLTDKRFKNKIVIVQFLGSWCPNCMDETAYLASFYDKYKDTGVEVVGLAYERTNDIERSRKNVEALKGRFNIGYPLLITGFTNKEVLKSMPALNEFKAFPTTILIDKRGTVRKIHTGFNGPGTGKYYYDFITAFEANVKQLLNEP